MTMHPSKHAGLSMESARFVEKNGQKRPVLLVLYIMVVACPLLLLGLLSLISGHNCFVGQPIWSDEIDYWREMYSFSACPDGSFGYYGFYGYPAPVGSWGCHGIAPPLVYGLPALIFGWDANSIVIYNMGFCMLAFVVLVCLVRPSFAQCICIIILWMLYMPVMIYAPSSMMELPEYACLILYMAFLLSALKDEDEVRSNKVVLIWGGAIVCFMSLLRISNIVFFLPLVLIVSNFRINKRFMLGIVLFIVVSACLYLFGALFTAGYPWSFLSSVFSATSVSDVLGLLASHFAGSLVRFVSFAEDPAQDIQRYAYLIVMVFCTVSIGMLLKKRCSGNGLLPYQSMQLKIMIISLIVLLGYSLLVIALYDVFDWRDYRTLASVLWSILILFVIADISPYTVAAFVAFCFIVALPFSINVFAAFEADRYEPPHAEEQGVFANVEPLGETAYDKTLLFDGFIAPEGYQYKIDPSIGILFTPKGSALQKDALPGYVFSSLEEEKSVMLDECYDLIWHDEERGLYQRR